MYNIDKLTTIMMVKAIAGVWIIMLISSKQLTLHDVINLLTPFLQAY